MTICSLFTRHILTTRIKAYYQHISKYNQNITHQILYKRNLVSISYKISIKKYSEIQSHEPFQVAQPLTPRPPVS